VRARAYVSALCGHRATRRLPPMVCRSLALPTPFGGLPAPTHLAQRASLLAGTASDVRAFPYRCAKLAAFRQVTQRSNPRDGLSCRYHASSDRCNAGRHRIRPTDRPTRLLRRPVSPGSMTFALAVLTGTQREPTKAPCGAGSSKATARTGCGVPCSQLSTGAAPALRASSNTYLTGFTTAMKDGALAPVQRSDERNDACAGNEASGGQKGRSARQRWRGARPSGNAWQARMYSRGLPRP